jgi:hypothetical protein
MLKAVRCVFQFALVFSLASLSGLGARADVVGRDDRVPVDPDRFPYVSELSYLDASGHLIFGNAWIVGHPRVFVTAAHLVAGNGVWLGTQSTQRPESREIARYRVRPAGCAEAVPVEWFFRWGTLHTAADPANDWVVGVLTEATCLRDTQLAEMLWFEEQFWDALFFDDANPSTVTAVAFNDRRTIGNTVPTENDGSVWSSDDSALHANIGRVSGVFDYTNDGFFMQPVQPHIRNRDDVGTVFIHDADTDEGDSGGIIHISHDISFMGQTYFVNGVIGMIVMEDLAPGVQRNFAAPISRELWSSVQIAVSCASGACD